VLANFSRPKVRGFRSKLLLRLTQKIFNAETYRILNSDLRQLNKVQLTLHFLRFGRKENRRFSPSLYLRFGFRSLRAQHKPTVLIIFADQGFEASNYLLALVEGLRDEYRICLVTNGHLATSGLIPNSVALVVESDYFFKNSFQCEAIVSWCQAHLRPVGAISVGGGWPAHRFLTARGVPSLAHFVGQPESVLPRVAWDQVCRWAGETLFHEDSMRDTATFLWPDFKITRPKILPLPSPVIETRPKRIKPPMEAAGVVVGAGELNFRCAPDLFIQVATELVGSRDQRDLKFRWVVPPNSGHVRNADIESFIQTLAMHSESLDFEIIFAEGIDELLDVLESASLVLDVRRMGAFSFLPLLSINLRVPFLTLGGGVGARSLPPEFLGSGIHLFHGNAPRDIADSCIQLLKGPASRRSLARQEIPSSTHSDENKHYAKSIQALLQKHATRARTNCRNANFLLANGFIDLRATWALGPQNPSRLDAAEEYVQAVTRGLDLYRPAPEFNPLVYKKFVLSESEEEPFGHFIESGRPPGPWLSTIFSAREHPHCVQENHETIVHVHSHYSKILEEMLVALSEIKARNRVVVSYTPNVSSQEKERIGAKFSHLNIDFRATQNRGRNFGSLLEFAAAEPLGREVSICHLHTKVSPQTEIGYPVGFADSWRNFLMEHLIGNRQNNLFAKISSSFQVDPNLGLVYPHDPILAGFDSNRPTMRTLCSEWGIEFKDFLSDFPVGGMFWARGDIIDFVSSRVKLESFESEPLPPDGSLAHSLERIFPWVSDHLGYTKEVTYVPGVRR